jgi:putative transposase/transposase-like zinc-binding protein
MNQPPFEVADIIRQYGKAFIENNRSWLTYQHLRVLDAIEHCRTAALGGHIDGCSRCGYRADISYNSCGSRHCPKCLTHARDVWLAERGKECLPVGYFHVVFTLPHELSWLALHNKKTVYSLLFRAAADTLLEVTADPQWLGAEVGFLSVLHSWGQNLQFHPHLHCILPSGGLSADHQRWVHPRHAFLPAKVLSKVFRGKFTEALKKAFRRGELQFPGTLQAIRTDQAFRAFLRTLFRKNWVVYAKPPFRGPEHLLQYLARYTHRVAISNHRILGVADGRVTFRWKDYAHGGKQRKMTLSANEFLRRFLLHVLPKGFIRIRFFGFLAPRQRGALLPLCRRLLGEDPRPRLPETPAPALWRCPRCGGPMNVVERLPARQVALRLTSLRSFNDSS